MHRRLKFSLQWIVLLTFLSSNIQIARAEYPHKNIRILLPYKRLQGDSALIAEEFIPILAKYLGVNISIELFPKPGSSVSEAHEKIKTAPNDGRVLMLVSSFDLTAYSAIGYISDDIYDHLDYIDLISKQALVCVTQPTSPMKDWRHFLQVLKSKPETVRHASWHLASQLYPTHFMKLAGINYHQVSKYVAKSGENPLDMLKNNQADFNCWTFTAVEQELKNGVLAPIFTNSFVKFKEFPTLPTAGDLRIKEAERFMYWTLLVGPKGLPPKVKEQLKIALDKVARDPAWVNSRVIRYGFNTIGKTQDVRKFVYEERDFYEKMAIFGKISLAK